MALADDHRLMSPLTLFDDDVESRPIHEFEPLTLTIAGRELRTSPVFDSYWRFAAERQNVYFRRLAGERGPWTDDDVLRRHRFTNAYRAADRVSQFLIGDVLYDGRDRSWDEQVFRVLLFKFFNKIETWQALEAGVGDICLDSYDYSLYAEVLDERRERGDRNYSAAYVVPPPQLGEAMKHRNHLRLLEFMLSSDVAGQLAQACSMKQAYETLISFPSIGKFLGFQFLIDLNYGSGLSFSEMDFVVAGPGAHDGIRKCFGPAAAGIEDEVISWTTATQEQHFDRVGVDFRSLFGRRLQLIDAQNLFCEVDKYARVVHPNIDGISGRTRIKQKFAPQAAPAVPVFPPKWGLEPRSGLARRG